MAGLRNAGQRPVLAKPSLTSDGLRLPNWATRSTGSTRP